MRKVLFNFFIATAIPIVSLLHAVPAQADGGRIHTQTFSEGINTVLWNDPSGHPSPISDFLMELEQASGLTVASVLLIKGETGLLYAPGTPAQANTLKEVPAFAILIVQLQCVALPDGIGVDFFFEENVSCKERQAVVQGVGAAVAYLATFQRSVEGVSAYVGSVNFLAPVYADRVGVSFRQARAQLQAATGNMRRNTIFINTDDQGWKLAAWQVRAAVAAHEFYHVLQVQLGCGCAVGPMWLWEGFPEFAAWKALAAANLWDFKEAKKDYAQRSWAAAPSLNILATHAGFQSTFEGYALSFVAVDFLVNGSMAPLIAFWAEVGETYVFPQGGPWEPAFLNNFGVTPERFYERFRSYRDADQNNPRYPGRPFEIVFRGTRPPLTVLIRPDEKPYVFQVYGVDLRDPSVGPAKGTSPIQVEPHNGYGWLPQSESGLMLVIIKRAHPSGVFRVTLTLRDGRSASTTFTHTSSQ